jgi:hypothetical protein
MTLIEIFTDYVFNKKDLRKYVEERKAIKERGEFNDGLLIQAQENLERLKTEDNEIYELMYETLQEYVNLDCGHTIEYPINFIKEILKLYKNDASAEKICKIYKMGLEHHCQDA